MNAINPHISSQFDADLEEIRSLVMSMGGLVEQQFDSALRALLENNVELGQAAASGDYQVNNHEVEIDQRVIDTIAIRQPTANDLRFLFTTVKVVGDLERIGDKAEKIGRLALAIQPLMNGYSFAADLHSMSVMVQKMLHDALDAFARMDADAAMTIKNTDKEVNATYRLVLADLMKHMSDNPNTLDLSMDILWCLRSIERVGDHVTNICEYIVFLVKGKDVRHTTRDDMMTEITE
ncbi:MAG: phosphate transport system regulatory protein PhoU [Gammaproteobacteria bacterium 28-57-27]|nr:MAG: phosphate transport system regulatory protein PhoU [Gammaproteobacteria bacterium 28-57-27]